MGNIKMKDTIKSYRDLVAWEKAMDLCAETYKIVRLFPKEELYGLAQQMRRSAVSVSCNIAEGWGRGMTGDYIRFLRTGRGSLCELETQVLLAQRLGFLGPEPARTVLAMIEECSRILQGLIASLERVQESNSVS